MTHKSTTRPEKRAPNFVFKYAKKNLYLFVMLVAFVTASSFIANPRQSAAAYEKSFRLHSPENLQDKALNAPPRGLFLSNSGVPDIQMGFEGSTEPYETMDDRDPDPNDSGNGCMYGKTWNPYYKFNVCIAPTVPTDHYAIEPSNAVARSGLNSLRFYLQPTPESLWPLGEATHRAELAPHHNSPIDRYPLEGEEFWYGLSYYFPSNFKFAPQSIANDIRFMISQWQHGSSGSPILSLEVIGDELYLQRKSGSSNNIDSYPPDAIATIQRGKWIDIVVRVVWSKTNGLAQAWVDGELSYDKSNIQTIYHNLNNGGGLKFGLYYWRWKELQSVQNTFDAGITYREIFIDEVHEYHGTNGYDVVAPGEALLPLNWLGFEAKTEANHTVVLNWQTASEKDNEFFSVERSKYGTEWQEITRVPGSNNAVEVSNYQIKDSDPITGTSYYRIKQVDFSGAFSYSSVKSVRIHRDGTTLNVYPNPAVDQIIIENPSNNLSNLRLYDLLGRDMSSMIVINDQDDHLVTMEMSQLPQGTFVLKSDHLSKIIVKQ